MEQSDASNRATGSAAELEQAYRAAVRDGRATEFAADLDRRWQASPDDVLLSAWHYRLQTPEMVADPARAAQWRRAVLVALVLGAIYAVLTSRPFDLEGGGPPLFFVVWAPLAACALVAYLAAAAVRNGRLWIVLSPLLAVAAYAGWAAWYEGVPGNYATLAMTHLPLLAWAAVGLYLLGTGLGDEHRFAFLIKSVELVVTGGIFLGAAVVFVLVTLGIFSAIGLYPPQDLQRVIVAAVAAFVPLMACVVVYDPRLAPARQSFDQGLGRLVGAVGRVLLPFTLLVGVIYIASIPANFWKPFEQRDVLIAYNAMLFAIMGLLVICTPLRADGSTGKWVRRGLITLVAMTVIVSIYALSATVSRTALAGFTANRVTIIGWNAINIVLLVEYLWRQWRAGPAGWVSASWQTFRLGMIAYPVWALIVILTMPIILVF